MTDRSPLYRAICLLWLTIVLTAGLTAPGSAMASHTAEPVSVALAGTFQDELGCPGDWQPDCAATALVLEDGVWQQTFTIPAGDWEYKVTLNGGWAESYGSPSGGNVLLSLAAGGDVKFYYGHGTHWVADSVNSVIATAAGSFQSELGCPGDWQPDCLRSWLQDPEGDGVFSFSTDQIPAGNYETKVAHSEGWDENYGAGGVPGGDNIPFAVSGAGTVEFSYDLTTHILTIGSFGPATYAIVHYYRSDGDYGDHTTGNYNDFWGLHLWGDGIDPSEATDWTQPKPFLGEDEYGRFAWIRLAPDGGNVNFIVHRGDTKDGTNSDRSFNSNANPEIWIKQDNGNEYATQASARGYAVVRYHRPDGDYGNPASPDYNDFWGLHLWGNAIDPSEATEWTNPKRPTGIDDYGAFWQVLLQDPAQPMNFIVHRGDTKDPGPDQGLFPDEIPTAWLQSGDVTIYPQRGAAEGHATLHYRRDAGDYGDVTSPDYNDFWGLHVWDGAASPTDWTNPIRPAYFDIFGPAYEVALVPGATELAYILHRGDAKDPGPDQSLDLGVDGHEVWQLEGANPDDPYILPITAAFAGNPGDIGKQRAYWIDERTIAWESAGDSANDYALHFAATGGLDATPEGVTGGESIILGPGTISPEAASKYPHLASLPALEIPAEHRSRVPEILRGQIAVSALDGEGLSVDSTGLQIQGVLDDLFTFHGELGTVFAGGGPGLNLWAPTARSVTLHLFDDADPSTTAMTYPMSADAVTGVWSIPGAPAWERKYYLFEVEVYVHSTGNVEHNLVTDPYSLSLSANSQRSQIVRLGAPDLKPSGWDALSKPALAAPEDIVVYELHVRDFSASDPMVPADLKGTFNAFALDGSYGDLHLGALAAAGLTHVHLLPAFDIATVNEIRGEWQEPDPDVLGSYPPGSENQQAAVTATQDLDGFNWGYDPFHYTTPDGSYATDPNGTARINGFREMVKALNHNGLRVVMDVVYNHTTASGQNDKSVLDRVVPGYYHRLNENGDVETSSCCDNTASEYAMMEKLMIDSIVTWAREYKVDGFRFDLMGHHSKDNILNVRAALDALTLEDDGVDGSSIYLYGEGWNFGEVANDARFVQATQLNMAGTGIGTFNDRVRDAARGGGAFGPLQAQGFVTGLCTDSNGLPQGDECADLLLRSDWIRSAMAGGLADYEFEDRFGNRVPASGIDYFGQPLGYTDDPQEIINYVSAHDNETLFDAVQLKVDLTNTMAERVRAQNLGMSVVLMGQGIPFLHAGIDMLRSKSMDRDSFNSGDWFNRLDFTYESNNWGGGLPVASKNQDNWAVMAPLLANPDLMPEPQHISGAVSHLQEMLQIRRSTGLFRLPTAAEVSGRLAFHNTGPSQIPGLIVMSLSDDDGTLDAGTEYVMAFLNGGVDDVEIGVAGFDDLPFELHPVQQLSSDPVVRTSAYDIATGLFSVPAMTTSVFIAKRSPEEQIDLIGDAIRDLLADGVLNKGQANALLKKLAHAQAMIARGKTKTAINGLNAFINQVEAWISSGILTAAQGEPLIEAAENVIADIGG